MSDVKTPSPERVRELNDRINQGLVRIDLMADADLIQALIAAWLRVGPAAQREPPHCPTCGCGMETPVSAQANDEQRPCFAIANKIAADTVKPFGPALAIAERIRDSAQAKCEAEPLEILSGRYLMPDGSVQVKPHQRELSGSIASPTPPSAQAREQPTMTSGQIEALRYLITDSDRRVDSMVNALRDPDYGVGLLKREQVLNDVRAEIAERQKHGDALRHFLVQQSAPPPVSAQAREALEAVEQLLRDYRDVPDVSDAEGQAVMERAARGIATLRSLSVGGVDSQWVPVGERLPTSSMDRTYWVTFEDSYGARTSKHCGELAFFNDSWWPPLGPSRRATAWFELPLAYAAPVSA